MASVNAYSRIFAESEVAVALSISYRDSLPRAAESSSHRIVLRCGFVI